MNQGTSFGQSWFVLPSFDTVAVIAVAYTRQTAKH